MTIKELRKSTGLSQSEFAKKFNLNKGSLANWEQGFRKPPEYVISMISKILKQENYINYMRQKMTNENKKSITNIDISKITEEESKKFKAAYDRVVKERIRKYNIASTKDYIIWLIDCLDRQPNHSYSDEDALYDDNSKIDKENGALLSYFYEFVENKAAEQNVENRPDEDNIFETGRYTFIYGDKYATIGLMIGQGSITYCSLCDKPNDNFVTLKY